MKNQDHIGITFVNAVAARGLFNNVANISFSAYNFTPTDEGQVEPDPAIVCRLRMDKGCMMQLRDVLNDLLALMDQPAPQPEEEPEAEGVIRKPRVSPETSH